MGIKPGLSRTGVVYFNHSTKALTLVWDSEFEQTPLNVLSSQNSYNRSKYKDRGAYRIILGSVFSGNNKFYRQSY